MRISKRQQVSLREVWPLETSFSDWLVSEAGLSLIAEDIGVEVEDPKRECHPGDFRCDIVGHALGDENHIIVIENQYGKTDHDHLGKMLTYAAVHAATTGIWLTERVSEDHRQVIDWLNNITPPNVNFFLAEIKAYRIDDSPVAPQLDVVCRPNLEVKVQRGESKQELKDRHVWRKEFWEEILTYIKDQNPPFNVQSPSIDHWSSIAIGRSNFSIALSLVPKHQCITCELTITPSWKDSAFEQLAAQREDIESELGKPLEWLPLPGRKVARIMVKANIDPKNDSNRELVKQWMNEQANAFYRVFRSRVQNLSADIVTTNSDSDDEVEDEMPGATHL